MASSGQLINQANCAGIQYDSGENDTSTSSFTYGFGNSMWFRAWSGSASNIYQPHPKVACEFWRFSISTQSWVLIDNRTIGRDTACIYQVRCTTAPPMGAPTAQYNGDDSYLFLFRATTTTGERSRCNDRIVMYNIGNDPTWNTTIKDRFIYGKPDTGVRYHVTDNRSGGAELAPFTTISMRGTLITATLVGRMISVRSAASRT